MAYNPQNPNGSTTSANSSPVVIATDQSVIPVSGTFFQATQPVSIASTVTVTGALTDTQLRATAVPVSSASLPLPTGASTETTLASLNGKVTAVNTGAVTISTALPTGANTIGAISNTGFAQISNSLVSTVNSTTANLASNATFTGTSEDVSEYSTVMVTIFTDQVSATDGFSFQFSSNGTNWDFSDTFTIPASTGKTFSIGVAARFFRVIYTNGATATTALRIQVLYSKASKKNSSVRPQDSRTNDNDFEEELAYGMVYDGVTNTWSRIRASAKGVQPTIALATQDLKDAGRNQVHYYTVIPVLTSATDTLQSLTGTKAGATVTATTTPAVVTTGKTLRITRMAATYIATATSGYGVVRLRFNTAGVVAITSPVATTFAVGSGTPATANATGMEEATLDEGWEFSAGTGIGISVQGFSAVTATAVGYVLVSITGYEY